MLVPDGKSHPKWSLYFDCCEARFHQEPVSLIDIDVQNGGSLVIWAKYVPNAKKIVGCDIYVACGTKGERTKHD